MDDVLGALEAQLVELKKYKARFGDLDTEGSNATAVTSTKKKSSRQSSRQSKQSKLDAQ
jgi:adenylate cyclase